MVKLGDAAIRPAIPVRACNLGTLRNSEKHAEPDGRLPPRHRLLGARVAAVQRDQDTACRPARSKHPKLEARTCRRETQPSIAFLDDGRELRAVAEGREIIGTQPVRHEPEAGAQAVLR